MVRAKNRYLIAIFLNVLRNGVWRIFSTSLNSLSGFQQLNGFGETSVETTLMLNHNLTVPIPNYGSWLDFESRKYHENSIIQDSQVLTIKKLHIAINS